jgi:hypothetical protein
LQRLESAKISEQAEQSNDNVKFRVIEPPSVPVKPSSPQRTQLNLLVLAASLGAGIGLAVLLAMLHPTFATREILEKVTGVRVIGAITAAMPVQRRALVPSPGGTRGRGRQPAARGLRAQPGLVGTAAGDAARRCRLRSYATCPLSNAR